SAKPALQYRYTTADVIAKVRAAYADASLVGSTTDLLETENQGGADFTSQRGSGAITSEGGEGLSHGYWKQSQHFSDWTAPYTTSSSFNTVFGVTKENGVTLLSALQRGGGGLINLARQGVAALLNAAHPRISFAFTVPQVIALVRAGYQDASLVESTATLLENENVRGADLTTGGGAAVWSVA